MSTITFTAGTTTTVTNFAVSGTVGNPVTINSSVPGTRFTLSQASGTVVSQYLSIQDSNATGGATWIASNSTDLGNNLGWLFQLYKQGLGSSINSAGVLQINYINGQFDETQTLINNGLPVAERITNSSYQISGILNETQNLVYTPPGQSFPGSLLFANNAIANIQTANTTAFAIGSSTDFTIECWVNAYYAPNSNNYHYYGIFQLQTRDYAFTYFGYTTDFYGGTLYASINTTGSAGSVSTPSSQTTYYLNKWTHIAYVRHNGYLNVYIDGFQNFGTSYPDTTSFSSARMIVGSYDPSNNNNYSFPGYIADFRFVIGTAVYTSSFTPPTTPPTKIANTALLLTMNSSGTALVDSSNNNLTLTNISTPSANVTFDTSNPFTYTPVTVPVQKRIDKNGNLFVSGYFDEVTVV